MWRFFNKDTNALPRELKAQLQAAMAKALEDAALARRMIEESRTVEELDVGRTELQRAHAAIQMVIRTAKGALGRPLLPVDVTAEVHRRLLEQWRGGPQITAAERERWFAA